MLTTALAFLSGAVAATPQPDQSLLGSAGAPIAVRLFADLGVVGQLRHRLQIDNNGTSVNVPRELGQDILFPYTRFQADLDLGNNRRNTLALLYQPLDFQSVVAPERPLTVGTLTFPAGRALRFRYGFPFWRLTWLYDVAASNETEIAFGVGLQIRNANIIYTSLDGSRSVSSRNIGPVPLLAFRGRGTVVDKFWMAGELQGFYAPISVLNGSTTDVEGAIADASLKLGLEGPQGVDAYLALRYIGGGAVGTSNNPDPFTGDGFTRNWLHFGAISLGTSLR